ncbi:hypothetical protein ACN47E_009308 [Coniothyrium glycines]
MLRIKGSSVSKSAKAKRMTVQCTGSQQLHLRISLDRLVGKTKYARIFSYIERAELLDDGFAETVKHIGNSIQVTSFSPSQHVSIMVHFPWSLWHLDAPRSDAPREPVIEQVTALLQLRLEAVVTRSRDAD